LAQGLARGLGVTDTVTSPTFALVHEYRGRLELFHMDLYRLASEEEFDLIGGWDYFSRGGVCVIEWAERLGDRLDLPRWILTLTLRPRGRTITVEQAGDI
jgi:tRNA threonylcarbamoyladenosine biosynthesis protein TsaE